MAEISIEPLTPTIGALVGHVDLRTPLATGVRERLHDALHQHLVLFFRDQPLAPPELLEFGAQFGPIQVHPFAPPHPEYPGLVVLDQLHPVDQGADAWHSDATFMPEPPMATLIQAVELPESGGDTLFANMHAAWERLSPPVREMLQGLTALHDISAQLTKAIDNGSSSQDLGEMQQRWPPTAHPVVRTHPETGRDALYVNGNYTTRIVELEPTESDRWLAYLCTLPHSPELQCRFRWEPGSLAIWDNRAVQHFAVPDYHQRRVMHRATVDGQKPVNARMGPG